MHESSAISVGAIKDAAPLNRYHLLIVALCAGVVFFDGFDLLTISYAAPHMARAFALSAEQTGLMFSAGLFGLCIGSLTVGFLSDRRGRRPALLLSVFLFAIGSLLTGYATGLHSLLLVRLLSGLGLGGATPVVIALVAEACPRRLRASLNMVMYCGLMLGGLFGGAITVPVLGSLGWQWVFYIGGVLPLLYLPVLVRSMPESIEYLVSQGASRATVAELLRRLAPAAGSVDGAERCVASPQSAHGSVRRLLAPDVATRTAYATAAMFFSLLTLFLYSSWLPSLLQRAGMPQNSAILVTLVGQVGNIAGSLLIARLIIWCSPYRLVGLSYAGAALALLLVASAPVQLWCQLPSNLLVGACLGGSQNALLSLSPGLFPVDVRTTGVGWVRGVGQTGAIAGPAVAGVLLGRSWAPAEILQLIAIAPVLAGAACGLLHVMQRREPREDAR